MAGQGCRGVDLSVRVRLTSAATGDAREAWAIVYRSRWHMARAAWRFNGCHAEPDCQGVTQAYRDENGAITVPVLRLHRGRLGVQVLAHEVSHAATAIYGSTDSDEPLDHANEPLAHLHSDLLVDLIVGLRRHRLID